MEKSEHGKVTSNKTNAGSGSGLAQVNGRNAIDWGDKLAWDLKYIEKVSFRNDLRIILMTVKKAFVTQEGITAEGMATAEDYGDDLLHAGKIDRETYDAGQALAREILRG